ncbi:hypothetical protein V6N13_098492 [Hibiscus sabdariffa]
MDHKKKKSDNNVNLPVSLTRGGLRISFFVTWTGVMSMENSQLSLHAIIPSMFESQMYVPEVGSSLADEKHRESIARGSGQPKHRRIGTLDERRILQQAKVLLVCMYGIKRNLLVCANRQQFLQSCTPFLMSETPEMASLPVSEYFPGLV